MSGGSYDIGQRVIYRFPAGIRHRGHQQIACVVLSAPFRGERDRPGDPLRVRAKCVQADDPMFELEFVPFVDRLDATR